MIRGGCVSGITAVVCGDHQNIIRLHVRLDLRQLLIKISQCLRIAVHISSMAVEHVIIHQIDKAESFEILVQIFQCPLNAFCVAGSVYMLGNALAYENILDLTHSNDILTGSLQLIQHGPCGRQQGKIVSSGSTGIMSALTDKRSRNDTAHTVFSL